MHTQSLEYWEPSGGNVSADAIRPSLATLWPSCRSPAPLICQTLWLLHTTHQQIPTISRSITFQVICQGSVHKYSLITFLFDIKKKYYNLWPVERSHISHWCITVRGWWVNYMKMSASSCIPISRFVQFPCGVFLYFNSCAHNHILPIDMLRSAPWYIYEFLSDYSFIHDWVCGGFSLRVELIWRAHP